MNIEQFAMNLIQQNPNLQNNPMAHNFIQILQSGNAQAGQQLAENICKTRGVSSQDAYNQARNFFAQKFGFR